MGPRVLVDDEKEKAVASFDRFHAVVRLRQISELVVVFALISWSTGRFPAVMKVTGACYVDFSDYLLNHHVVFLIGNAIIVLLFMLCRRSDASVSGGCFYDDYVKYSEAAARQPEPALPSPSTTVDSDAESGCVREEAQESVGGDDGEKQVVVRADVTRAISQCDDVAAAAIEKAKRQIQRFQRTQSEKLKREISVKTPPVFRRSETDNHRKTVRSRAAEMETLSNEEFRRKVDAFIDAHWSGRKGTKNMSFENYPLLKMA